MVGMGSVCVLRQSPRAFSTWPQMLVPGSPPPPAPTCPLSCGPSPSFASPPHSPTSPLKKHPRQGRTRGLPSRPRAAEHPHRRAGAGRRSRRPGSLGAGVQGGSPGSGGGAVPGQGLGAGACRAPGRRLPAAEGPRRSRDSEVPGHTGAQVPAAGSPDWGLSGCTLHWATPAPSLQHFGVTGMGPSLQRPISGRPGA